MPDQAKDIEIRTFSGDQPIEMRADEEDAKKNVIEGYAALFESETELWPGHSEKIARGAFDEVLAAKPDCRCLYNHDMNFILGRTLISATLKLEKNDTGLRYICELPATANGEMVAEAIRRGDVNQSSFSFRAGKTSWDERDDDEYMRTIERVDELYDVGPVTMPAYKDTSVALRSAQEWRSANGKPALAMPGQPAPPAPPAAPAAAPASTDPANDETRNAILKDYADKLRDDLNARQSVDIVELRPQTPVRTPTSLLSKGSGTTY